MWQKCKAAGIYHILFQLVSVSLPLINFEGRFFVMLRCTSKDEPAGQRTPTTRARIFKIAGLHFVYQGLKWINCIELKIYRHSWTKTNIHTYRATIHACTCINKTTPHQTRVYAYRFISSYTYILKCIHTYLAQDRKFICDGRCYVQSWNCLDFTLAPYTARQSFMLALMCPN